LIVALIFGPQLRAIAQDISASDLSGRWTATGNREFTFQSAGNGEITMRVIGSENRKDMHFKGKFERAGFTVSARVTSVSHISSDVPLAVRRQTLAKYPNITYRYDVKLLDKDAIELTAYGHSITRTGNQLKRVNLNVNKTIYKLTRLPKLPNLRVAAFTSELKGTASDRHWVLRATVENSGDGDVDKDYLITVWYSDRDISPAPGRPWKKISYTPSLRPPLRKGRQTIIEWRTNKKTETGGTPFLPDSAVVMKVEVDPKDEIGEILETDNFRMLNRVCLPPDTSANADAKVVWIDRRRLSIDEKANQVLCHIKTKAIELAKIDQGTVRDSQFVAYLRTVYLRHFYANPTAIGAKKLIKSIGAPMEEFELLAGFVDHRLYVPKSFRQKYGNRISEHLYIATDILLQINTPMSPVLAGQTVMDVPFLLGDENYGAKELSDWQKGGKNWSNVMHWATGLKYYYLPAAALQELFVGYEYWHMEGLDRFGEDAINDLIAEEQGRLLGKALVSGQIRNHRDLVRVMDQSFRTSRAWVGAILRLSQERLTKTKEKRLDFLTLYREFLPTDKWLTGGGYVVRPWSYEKGSKTIRAMLVEGKSIYEVNGSPLVLRLTNVYELIYEAVEWEKKNGKIQLTPIIQKIINGGYDKQFKAAPKGNDDEWKWKP